MSRTIQRAVGSSQALATALNQASALAAVNRPVLILGERGSGKELIAERLHFLSPRWDQPFVSINCAAISEDLMESDLFGHEPGAFTGATRVHHGRFERADGGTLFLDELGTMSSRLQEKLLRLIEYGEFERLGGQKTLKIDVRVVAATNADLQAMASQDTFRADLLDRLAFDVIHVPPLRQRKEDIQELAEHFALRMTTELGWDYFPGFSHQAMEQLQRHHWPGNVRELRNTVERSLFRHSYEHTLETAIGQVIIDPFKQPESFHQSDSGLSDSPAVPSSPTPQTSNLPFKQQVALFQQQLLEEALAANQHNQRKAAKALGLTYDQMRGMVRKFSQDTPS